MADTEWVDLGATDEGIEQSIDVSDDGMVTYTLIERRRTQAHDQYDRMSRLLSRRGDIQYQPDAGSTAWSAWVDANEIAEGYPVECVKWVCPTHHRHCTHLDTKHDQHRCVFDE